MDINDRIRMDKRHAELDARQSERDAAAAAHRKVVEAGIAEQRALQHRLLQIEADRAETERLAAVAQTTLLVREGERAEAARRETNERALVERLETWALRYHPRETAEWTNRAGGRRPAPSCNPVFLATYDTFLPVGWAAAKAAAPLLEPFGVSPAPVQPSPPRVQIELPATYENRGNALWAAQTAAEHDGILMYLAGQDPAARSRYEWYASLGAKGLAALGVSAQWGTLYFPDLMARYLADPQAEQPEHPALLLATLRNPKMAQLASFFPGLETLPLPQPTHPGWDDVSRRLIVHPFDDERALRMLTGVMTDQELWAKVRATFYGQFIRGEASGQADALDRVRVARAMLRTFPLDAYPALTAAIEREEKVFNEVRRQEQAAAARVARTAHESRERKASIKWSRAARARRLGRSKTWLLLGAAALFIVLIPLEAGILNGILGLVMLGCLVVGLGAWAAQAVFDRMS